MALGRRAPSLTPARGRHTAHTSKLETRESCHCTVCGRPTFQQSRRFEQPVWHAPRRPDVLLPRQPVQRGHELLLPTSPIMPARSPMLLELQLYPLQGNSRNLSRIRKRFYEYLWNRSENIQESTDFLAQRN